AQRSFSGRCRHEGMAPRPFVTFQKSSPSASSCTFFDVQSAGFGFSATAAGPLPFPSGPWHDTQLILATFSPCSIAFLSVGKGFFLAFSDAGATHGADVWAATCTGPLEPRTTRIKARASPV